MARSNGGIIGKTNKTSFGKCTVTTKTSSGTVTTQPGTRVVKTAIIAGGGAGGDRGGGGAGGLRNIEINTTGGSTLSATIGAGGAAPGPAGLKGAASSLAVCGTTYSATGGGQGFGASTVPACANGGSGGGNGTDGSATPITGGAGNTPPTSPSQGNPGGGGSIPGPNVPSFSVASGGGGAGAAGTNISFVDQLMCLDQVVQD